MKVKMMSTSDITVAPFNPILRTGPERLTLLMDSIEENGIEMPLHLGKDGILGDGHRRLACAQTLGIQEVPVIRSSTRTGAEIYGGNCTQKATRGAEWLQAVAQGFPISLVPQPYRGQIEHMQRIHSTDEFNAIANSGQSPYIVGFARFVGRHIGDTSDDTIRKIVLWFIKHGIQYKTRKAIEGGCPPSVVQNAITQDRPVTVVYQ